MKTDDRAEIIERTLRALEAPELRKAKASRVIEGLVVGAKQSGKLAPAELLRAVDDLVVETGAATHLARRSRKDADDPGSEAFSGLFALFFLLILLLLLLARFGDDSDAAAQLEDLIQQLLDLLKGGGVG